MIAEQVPPAPRCPSWCTAHPNLADDEWDDTRTITSDTEVTKMCEGVVGVLHGFNDDELHSAELRVQRHAYWCTGFEDIEIDERRIQLEGISFSPMQAERLGDLMRAAAKMARRC